MFGLMALDKDFNLISPLAPTNIQWNRKYHESGGFSIQLPLEQYTIDMKYVYSKDRPEVGKIKQRRYTESNGFAYMQLSGYFLENELNRHVVYPKGAGNINGSPDWTGRSGKAEDVAYQFYDGFKKITVGAISSDLGFPRAPSLNRGKKAEHTRNGEFLGAKIYDILKPSGMSYRIAYDLQQDMKRFCVWKGKDLTLTNAEGNNPVVFSTRFGNLNNPDLYEDETGYKNICINVQEKDEKYTLRALVKEEAEEYSFLYLKSGEQREENVSDEEFAAQLDSESRNALSEHEKVLNIEFDAETGSYVYQQDFDLGDLCDIEVAGVISMEARLIACYEVIKSGEWTMTMEFGTPLVKKGGKN